MRIAQVAPLYESVPPKLYGGTERVVSYLTEQLIRQGHEVTLFASADSQTWARLIPGCDQALRLNPLQRDPLALHVLQLQAVAERLDEFDIIHFHTDYLHFPTSRYWHKPHITTLHGRLDLAELVPLYGCFNHVPVVSISNAQRSPLPMANWVGTVYHGLPGDFYRPGTGGGGYLAFLGRICPDKRVDRAIDIAQRAGLPLKIAAKVDKVDQDYFERTIVPLLDHPLVDYIGEISDAEKGEFLGDALALLFPIDWPEPFGMVMIEALACGTPVIAFPHGSVPEIIANGETGFIVDSVEAAVAAVERLPQIARRGCRETFETRFSARRMAQDYLKLYDEWVARNPVATIRAKPRQHSLPLATPTPTDFGAAALGSSNSAA